MKSRVRIVRWAVLLVLMFSISSLVNALEYTSYVYNTCDLIFFSYEDGTIIEIYEPDGSVVLDWQENRVLINDSDPMYKGEYYRLTLPNYIKRKHVYKVTGSKKFSVLSGDAALPFVQDNGGGVSGYYAMTPEGLGTAKEFYTYVATQKDEYADNQFFIVFAYTDDTTVTVQQGDPNGVYSNFTDPFILDAGEHWATTALDCNYVHIDANEPVSALVCYDFGYYVPAGDSIWSGKWVGTEFYTYVSAARDPNRWEDLAVIAWENGTSVTITNSEDPNEIFWQGLLRAGHVHIQSDPNEDRFYSITSNKPVSVSVQPWLKDEGYALYSSFAPSRSGYGTGQEFLLRTQGGEDYAFINILSHTNDAHIDRYNVLTGQKVESYTLDRGESQLVFPGTGRWRIVTDDGFISVCSGLDKSIYVV